MKKKFFRTISGILILSFILPFSMITAPKTVSATGIPVVDAALNSVATAMHVQLTTISGTTGLTSTTVTATNIFLTVLNKIAVAAAKAILQKITLDVIDWINSGFQGSPAFVQNPEAFFTNIGDQVLGSMIAANGDLKFLCSPFNIDVRLALAMNRASYYNKYTCTLSDVIKNSKNAVQNASINGFNAGDFKQGGWPAFVTMATEPQNTPNGAYLAAEADLQIRIAGKTIIKKDQLFQGSGFLSWDKCTTVPGPSSPSYVGPSVMGGSGAYSTSASGNVVPSTSILAQGNPNTSGVGGGINITQTMASAASTQSCHTETPGSVISAALNKHLAVPTEELELANDVNAIINALFTQLITTALNKGLAAISKSSSSGGPSLSSQINNLQSQANQQQLSNLQGTLTNSIGPLVQYATAIQSARDQELTLETNTKNTLQSALDCYTAAQNTLDSAVLGQSTYDSAMAYLQDQITQIQDIIAQQITPIDSTITAQSTQALQLVTYVNDIQTRSQSAASIDDLNIANQEYLNLIQTPGSIPQQTDVVTAQQDLANLQTNLSPVLIDAQNRYQAYQAYVAPQPGS